MMTRLNLRSVAVALGIAAAAAAAPAKAVPVTIDFDLTGFGFFADSHSYSAGGLNLDVSGSVFNDAGQIIEGSNAWVFESPFGVGVQSQFLDLPLIDGAGLNEVAVLSFDADVVIDSLTFGFGEADENFQFFTGAPGGSLVLQGSDAVSPSGSAYSFSEIWLNDLFGIGAQGSGDGFLLKRVSVLYDAQQGGGASAVPLPASILLLGSLITAGGLISVFRRRRSGPGNVAGGAPLAPS